MKSLTLDQFKKYFTPEKILTREEFYNTEYFPRQFNNFKDLPEDHRRIYLEKNGGVSLRNWMDTAYNIYFEKFEEILEQLYFRRFEQKDFSKVNYKMQPVIDAKIDNVKFYGRELKNLFFEEMFLDSYVVQGTTAKAYFEKLLTEGTVGYSDLTTPSIFNTLVRDGGEPVISDAIVSMIRKRVFAMSIYSPRVYGSLLNYQNEKFGDPTVARKNLLCPTASWGSPLIAVNSLSTYKKLTIVDVQSKVIEKCKTLYSYLETKNGLMGIDFEFDAFCIPSQKMSTVIRETYDHVFFCPPYYDLEIYGGENQSTDEFKTLEEWLEGYWRGTCVESDKLLTENGLFSFTIDLFNSPSMLEIAKQHFDFLETQEIRTFAGSTSKSKKVNE